MDRKPHFLMCPPDHFGVHYEINPWMSLKRPCDHELAVRQWNGLRRVLEEAGAEVSCVEPMPGLPDLVFTANAALVWQDLAVLSRFRHPQRRDEEPCFRRWFAGQGYRVHELEGAACFEGAGDALFCGETLFGGYRIRSDIGAYQEIGSLLGCRVVPLELINARFYHLDTCFCPIAPGVAMYYAGAFDSYGRRALAELVGDLIPVTNEEAARLACNAAVVGNTVVTPAGCPQLQEQLRSRGFAVREAPVGEFIKAGGAVKCLTLRLDGEEAAAWRQPPGTLAAAVTGASRRRGSPDFGERPLRGPDIGAGAVGHRCQG